MKKNIAIIITRLDLGGAQKVALYLASRLDRKKFNVHFIAGVGGYLDKEVVNCKLKIENCVLMPELVHPIHPIKDVIAALKLSEYFKKNKIDIVHTHSSKAGIIGRLAGRLAGVKANVHTVHGFPFHEFQNPLMHFVYWLLEWKWQFITDRFIAVGKDVMDYGMKKGIGKKGKYVIIRPGVDLKAFGAQGSKLKAKGELKKYGLDPRKFTVGMIGNCKKQKNPMEFAKIAKLVLDEEPECQFIFAGDGPLKAGVERYLQKASIADRVKFIGWTDEPEKFMKSLDLFLLTSLWEGIPCTLAQAAAAGLPIIASGIDGNREFMNAAGAGPGLYKPGDTAAAAAKTAAAMAKKPRAGYKGILGEFGLGLMVKKHENLYMGL